MRQENNEIKQKLIEAEQLIKAQEKLIEVLQTALEIKEERLELVKETFAYYCPNAPVELNWKRVYYPVIGKIKAPPFSKN